MAVTVKVMNGQQKINDTLAAWAYIDDEVICGGPVD